MFPHCCVLDVFILLKNRKLPLKVTSWVLAVKLRTSKKERTEQIEIVGGPHTCVLREQKKLGFIWADVLLVSGHGGKAALRRRYHTMLTYSLA